MAWKNIAQIRADLGVKRHITDPQLTFASAIAESEISICLGDDFTAKRDQPNVIYAHEILTYYHALSAEYSNVKTEQDEKSGFNEEVQNTYFSPKELTEKLNQLYGQARTLLRPDCTLSQQATSSETTLSFASASYKPTPINPCDGGRC